MSRLDYLFTEFRVIVTYIRLLFLPINQNLDYDYPTYNSFLNPNVFLSFLLLLSIFGLAVYLFYYSKKPSSLPNRQASFNLHPSTLRLTAFGIFWFFITLSVESSVIPIVDVIFEHRLYLPSIGFFVTIITSIFIIADRPSKNWDKTKAVVISLLLLIMGTLLSAAYARNNVWQEKITFWQDVVTKSPKNPRGYYNLGLAAYYNNNDMVLAAIAFETSKKSYYKVESHAYLGNIYAYSGQYDKAISNFTIAIDKYDYALWKDKTNNAYLYYNRGQAYYESGAIDNAIKDFTIACQKGFDRGCYKLSESTVK
jgi:tetratricopeptide (TPR) repeat protein